MSAPWALNFEIDDRDLQVCLDELVLLFRRGLLSPKDIDSIIEILKDSEIALTGSFRDFRSFPTTHTAEACMVLKPSDSLVELIAAIRTRISKTAALTDV